MIQGPQGAEPTLSRPSSRRKTAGTVSWAPMSRGRIQIEVSILTADRLLRNVSRSIFYVTTALLPLLTKDADAISEPFQSYDATSWD